MKFLFFDLETTGLPKRWDSPVSDSSNWPRMIQIAWILSDKYGNVIDEKEEFIYPEGFLIPYEATKIHGITTEEAKLKGKPLSSILNVINNVINNSDLIIGHNIKFDHNVLGAEFFRMNIKSNLYNKEKICTMVSSTSFCAIPVENGFKFPTLTELHQKLFNADFVNAHNALHDTRVTKKCFEKLVALNIIKIKESVGQPSKSTSVDLKEKNTSMEQKSNSLDLTHYQLIWSKLSLEWKMAIGQEFYVYSQYSASKFESVMKEEFLSEPDLKALVKIFRDTKCFSTGTKVKTLDPLLFFENLEHLVIGSDYYYREEEWDDDYNVPLYGNTIKYGNYNIKSLEIISEFKRLKSLDINDCPVSDLSPIKDSTTLQTLKICDTEVITLKHLTNLINLKELEFDSDAIEDLHYIEHLPKLKLMKR